MTRVFGIRYPACGWMLAFALLGGCRQPPAESPPTKMRVLLVGLDGASWNVLQPMLDRGALPNLQRIVDEGVSGPIESDLPCLSIVLWTSVATGKLPEQHGIHDWSYIDPETGEKGLMGSGRRLVPALWNIASEAGLRVGFVNWWATWPAESVSGFIVSEQLTRTKPGEVLERGAYPESLVEELGIDEELEWSWLTRQLDAGSLKVLSDRNAPSASFEDRMRQAHFLYDQDYRGEIAAFHLLTNEPHPQLLGYLSRKIDIASHYMWQFSDEKSPSDQELSELLEPVYRYEDELVGRLLDEAGPDVNVIILSDHGFTWESDGWGHEETAPPGIFLAMGPAFRRGVGLDSASLYDVTPTILHLLHMPVGKDMAGEVLVEALVEDRSVRHIESYDDVVDTERIDAESPFDERILEELEALGYVP